MPDPADNPRAVWRNLRHEALAELAATHTLREISGAFGLGKTSVYERLKRHGLKAKAHEFPRATPPAPAERIKRCTATAHGAMCAAPLDPDGTCRWTHQHTKENRS